MMIVWCCGIVIFIVGLINWIISIIKKDMDKVALWFLVLSFGNVIIQLSELIK